MSTATIELNHGKVAIIDLADEALVRPYRWRAFQTEWGYWYAATSKATLLHRFLLDAPKGLRVDHINRDTLDCRRANLRLCTVSQNNANAKRPRHNKSGFKGVSYDSKNDRWYACISVNDKTRAIGTYSTPEEAARAYDDAAREIHGEFARLNFPAGHEQAA